MRLRVVPALVALAFTLTASADVAMSASGRSLAQFSERSGAAAGRAEQLDLSFYMTDADGRPVAQSGFVRFDTTGASKDGQMLFDDARNWAMLAELIADPEIKLNAVYVDKTLRARLLRQAERAGAAPSVRLIAARLMVQPRRIELPNDRLRVRLVRLSPARERLVADVRELGQRALRRQDARRDRREPASLRVR